MRTSDGPPPPDSKARQSGSRPSTEGPSKGVGFARLYDRASALDAIGRLRGKTLDGSVAPLQIRFADTEPQKILKASTKLPRSTSYGASRPVTGQGSSRKSQLLEMGGRTRAPSMPAVLFSNGGMGSTPSFHQVMPNFLPPMTTVPIPMPMPPPLPINDFFAHTPGHPFNHAILHPAQFSLPPPSASVTITSHPHPVRQLHPPPNNDPHPAVSEHDPPSPNLTALSFGLTSTTLIDTQRSMSSNPSDGSFGTGTVETSPNSSFTSCGDRFEDDREDVQTTATSSPEKSPYVYKRNFEGTRKMFFSPNPDFGGTEREEGEETIVRPKSAPQEGRSAGLVGLGFDFGEGSLRDETE
ncbi:hypothetical protein BT69DRAFT_911520 [Atractiella rhizophila]|nr:hypothetical protein BT69DRAFT_911520 [Atractiella rhizophila]